MQKSASSSYIEAMITHSSLEFSNLPLEEVVVRVSFAEPRTIAFEHLVKVWANLQAIFPTVSDLPHFETAPLAPLSVSATHLPGILLQNPDLRVTIQENLIAARWNRIYETAYPRYASLREGLRRTCDELLAVLGDSAPIIRVTNMTYTNLLVPSPSEDASAYVRRFLKADLLPVPTASKKVHDVNVGWSESDDVDLRYTIQMTDVHRPAVSQDGAITDELRRACLLTTTAGTFVTNSATYIEDLDRMHNALQMFFKSIVTEHALKEWGYADSN